MQPPAFALKRCATSIAVILLLAILQVLPPALSNQVPEALVRLGLWLVVGPIFMLVLFAVFRWGTRRRLNAGLTVAATLAVAASLGVVVGVGACFFATRFPGVWPSAHPPSYRLAVLVGVVLGVSMCGIWALAFVFPFAAEDARLREVEAEKLRLEAQQLRTAAELARLRTQLEPHFLLNTLNAIAGLCTQDVRETRRLIACLGDLLRDVLRDADELQVLGDQVAWLRRYAEILESRHAGSLCFQWDIAAPANDVLLPRLILQPLVENAVKHGALRRSGGGRVMVRAAVVEADGGAARLVCAVEDNGPGMPVTPTRSGAFGLHAVRRRIELKYPDGSLQLDSSPAGTRAVVELPIVGAVNGAA
jgi:signal transduction histidine kinase